MTESTPGCLNCNATESDAPLLLWRFQGREFWLCAGCLPIIIHKREQLMVKWPPTDTTQQTPR